MKREKLYNGYGSVNADLIFINILYNCVLIFPGGVLPLLKNKYFRQREVKKILIILLLISIGFISTPNVSYACNSYSAKAETSFYSKGKTCDESCCGEQHSKKGVHDDCTGGCNNVCHCPSVTAVAVPFISTVKHYIFIYSKQRYYPPGIILSSGFHSIWLPPKIS